MALVGTGATFALSTQDDTWAGEIVSISHANMELPAVECTNLGSSAREYIQGKLVEPGEVTVEALYDPVYPWPNIEYSKQGTAVTQSTVTIEFPEEDDNPSTTANFTASGFITGVTYNLTVEERVLLTVTVKLTGALTYAVEVPV